MSKCPQVEIIELKERLAEMKEELARARNLISDFIDDDDTPDANCSCHISPPCRDCVNHGWRRELIARAKALREIAQERCDE